MEYVKKLVKGDYHGCTECCQVLYYWKYTLLFSEGK